MKKVIKRVFSVMINMETIVSITGIVFSTVIMGITSRSYNKNRDKIIEQSKIIIDERKIRNSDKIKDIVKNEIKLATDFK